MERYIGVDPHSASCTLGVVSSTGKRLRELVVETNGEALVSAVVSIPGKRHLCIEEGQYSAWLYEILSPHAERTVVAVPLREPGNKSDAIDAYGMAERLRNGTLRRTVYKAPSQFAELRERSRVYVMVVKDVVRCRNRLKSLYRSRGIDVSGERVYDPEQRAQWLSRLPSTARTAAGLLHAELESLLPLRKEAERALLTEARRHPIAKLLETCPGLGPIRVAQLLPVVVTPHRFRSVRSFWSYCGLGIVMRSSSDWVQAKSGSWVRAEVKQARGLNRNHNHVLKGIFKGAAETVVAIGGPTPLRATYERLLEQGTKPNLAKLTVARKIAATVLRMWRDEVEYDPTR